MQENKKKKIAEYAAATAAGKTKTVAAPAKSESKEDKMKRRHEEREKRILEEIAQLGESDNPMKEKMLKEL